MKSIFLKFKKKDFLKIKKFLDESRFEQNIFLFLTYSENTTSLIFEVGDFIYIDDNEDRYYLETKDEIISKIIKKAFLKNFSLCEIHSHPFSFSNTTFSEFDLSELAEFVPYIFWRLEKKPYIALVFGRSDFDAKVWLKDGNTSVRLNSIIVNKKFLKPTNISFQKKYG